MIHTHTHTQTHLLSLPLASLFLGGWSGEGGLAELWGATQHRGDNVHMQSVSKWVIEFHRLSSWYSGAKRRMRARMIERKREEGETTVRSFEISWDALLGAY